MPRSSLGCFPPVSTRREIRRRLPAFEVFELDDQLVLSQPDTSQPRQLRKCRLAIYATQRQSGGE